MNKDKTIKDLKERNNKLLEQYRLRDFRCITLEKRLEILEQENKELKRRINKVASYIEEVLRSWKKEKEYHLVFDIDKILFILKLGKDNEDTK